jgi:membrane protease YdiL (CAAX protease family)
MALRKKSRPFGEMLLFLDKDVSWLWSRLPVIVRAVLTGTVVGLIAPLGVGIPMALNLNVAPGVPWSIPVAVAWLWLVWRYLNGHGWPRATSARRRELLRARPLTAPTWFWSLLTCALLLTFNLTFHFAHSRFQPVPMDLQPNWVLAFPPFTLVLVLLVISAQAGIVEEAAFRGYMFTPIEQKHGPMAATLIVSVVFVLSHFNNPQNLTVFRIVNLFLGGVVFAVLVVVTRSILPGLITHAAADAIGFLLLWRAAVRKKEALPQLASLNEALSDPTFLTLASVALASGAAAIWAFLRLRNIARTQV